MAQTTFVAESVRSQARELLSQSQGREIVATTLVMDDGSELVLPEEVVAMIAPLIAGLAHGEVRMREVPEELTTTMAASFLGVSRPTLMQLVTNGLLESRRVGSHHRFLLGDVVAFREARRATQAEALAALRAFDEERGIE
ncbi:helix-turn-helix domain-containing protein [Leucobacter albus]|uniref:Helix-turn-helix domain-containing protein n=1 Tax=Leucobacter albus TaxID=272210 RepID=A0ABW3TIU3_9MICO